MNQLNELPLRIKKIYDSCTAEEQKYLIQILRELSETGQSPTYTDLWLSDYKEIPVDINTFIESDAYLGKTNRNGKAVYPYWRTTLNDIFSAGNKYEEIILTGATRIGKSSTGITGTAYMLYRLMCLKDPQKYFHKKDVSKFSILFFNITKDLAKGVAYREFNDTLKVSPWFNDHGTFSKSERDFYYIPEGGKIVIDYGSDASHGLGMQVFVGFMDECLVGDTQVVTDQGIVPIKSIAGQSVNVLQYDIDTDSTMYVKADVVETKQATELVKITLEDGSIIEGTPEHPVMLKDGSYKSLGELTGDDELMDIHIDTSGDYSVYVHTSPTGKRYVGITRQLPHVRWGCNGVGYKEHPYFWNAIKKHGWNNFSHEIVYSNLSEELACKLEIELISHFKSNQPEFGYNLTVGGHISCHNIWVHNDEHEITIPKNDLKMYLSKGYKRGRLLSKTVLISKGEESIKISKDQLDNYLSEGWSKGRPQTIKDQFKKRNQKCIYTYKSHTFNSVYELKDYLRTHGYPEIGDSTITLICNGKIIKKYPELSNDITRKFIGGTIT